MFKAFVTKETVLTMSCSHADYHPSIIIQCSNRCSQLCKGTNEHEEKRRREEENVRA